MMEVEKCNCGTKPTFCDIGVRYYCEDCKNWSPVNYGDRDAAVRIWNKHVKQLEAE